jgi:hypothetical protein
MHGMILVVKPSAGTEKAGSSGSDEWPGCEYRDDRQANQGRSVKIVASGSQRGSHPDERLPAPDERIRTSRWRFAPGYELIRTTLNG